jgi:hypothetical protein
MPAPADIMSRERFLSRTANLVAAFFRNLLAALDKAQRKKATQIIRRYSHLIHDEDSAGKETESSSSPVVLRPGQTTNKPRSGT